MLALLLGLSVGDRARGEIATRQTATPTRIPASDPISANVANLKDQLEKGLRLRRPEEFAYIAYIVGLVEANELPVQLVIETFQWSRRQDPHFPFPYFQRAIRIRAARIGIVLN